MAAYLRQSRSPLAPVTLSEADLARDLAAAYDAMAVHLAAAPDHWGGWKLGGTNHASRAAFGVTAGYFGALDRGEILDQPTYAPGFALCEMKGEVEIALRLDSAGQGYDAWCVALEMPACPISNLLEMGVRALVADRCGAGALVLGPVQAGALPDLAASRFTLRADGIDLSVADLGALVAPPQALLTEFLQLARSHGITPCPGDWIATGGITACRPFAPGARVQVLLDDVVQLDLIASGAPA